MEYALILKTLNSGNNTNSGKECLIQVYVSLFQFDIAKSAIEMLETSVIKIEKNIVPIEKITFATSAYSGITDDNVCSIAGNNMTIDSVIPSISRIFSKITNKNIYVIGHNILDDDLRVINRLIEQTNTLNPIVINHHKLIDIQEFAMQEFPIDTIGNYSIDSILFASSNSITKLHEIEEFKVKKWQEQFCKQYSIEILQCLKQMMILKKYTTLSQVSQQLNTLTIVNELQFGKYKGQKIVDIFQKDNEYLCWLKSCKEVMDKNPNLKYTLDKLFEV